MVFNESLHSWLVDLSLLDICLLEVSCIVLDNYCLKFIVAGDFTPEFAWNICFDQTEVFIFLSNLGLDSVDRRNFEVVMEIVGVRMDRLESRLWGVYCMSFKITLVVLVYFLGMIGIVPFIPRNFDSVEAATKTFHCISHISIDPLLMCQIYHTFHLFLPVNLTCGLGNILGIFPEPFHPLHCCLLLGSPKFSWCRADSVSNFALGHCCSFLEISVAPGSKETYFLVAETFLDFDNGSTFPKLRAILCDVRCGER